MRFTAKGDFLISIGSLDETVFQWRVRGSLPPHLPALGLVVWLPLSPRLLPPHAAVLACAAVQAIDRLLTLAPS